MCALFIAKSFQKKNRGEPKRHHQCPHQPCGELRRQAGEKAKWPQRQGLGLGLGCRRPEPPACAAPWPWDWRRLPGLQDREAALRHWACGHAGVAGGELTWREVTVQPRDSQGAVKVTDSEGRRLAPGQTPQRHRRGQHPAPPATQFRGPARDSNCLSRPCAGAERAARRLTRCPLWAA